jgi:hypothetical protein
MAFIMLAFVKAPLAGDDARPAFDGLAALKRPSICLKP